MKTKLAFLAVSVALCGAANATSNDNNGVQKQIDDLRAGQHNDHMLILDKYSESWGLEDRGNIAKLQESKLDKSVFAVDQARQDKALADTVTKQAAIDSKQTSDLKSYADKKATPAYATSVAHTDVKVARADADRKAGDDALAVRAEGIEKRAQVTDDRSINNAVRLDGAEGAIRETNAQVEVTDKRSQNNAVRLDGVESVNIHQDTRITQNSSDIVQLYSNGEYAQSRIDVANANIQANHDAIRSTNRVVSQHTEQLANHEQRLGNLEQETQRGFSSLHRELGKVKKSANAGTSAALSSAAIPQVTEYQTFAVGAGVGGYEGEQALAVGFSARVTSNMVMKASVTQDTNQGTGWNVGTSIGW